MKAITVSGILFFLGWLISCDEGKTIISSDFDRGSIGECIEVRPGVIEGRTKHWIKRDSIGDQYYWFYFRADQVLNRKITFQLDDLEGIYRSKAHLVYTEYTRPVYSYDQKKWHRIEKVSYNSGTREFKFVQRFEQDSVWIAYAHPYPYDRMQKLAAAVQHSRYAKVEEIARTTEGRPVHLFTITDDRVPDVKKKTLMVMAMQHSGEDAGTFLAEGLISFLISDYELADRIRKHFVYKVIPMMNPDGVFHGTTRYNMNMEDLNNIWIDEDRMQPEVKGVQDWLEAWQGTGRKVDFFVDVHNHTQLYTYNVFIFVDHAHDEIVTSMNRYWPSRLWHAAFEGSSVTYFQEAGIPGASLELTQSFSENEPYLVMEDYHQYGRGLALGFYDFFTQNR